ncbi:MAG: class I SAM-dependent methyltransferase [Cytophagaceae bacterium]
MECRLCHEDKGKLLSSEGDKRSYWLCYTCSLITCLPEFLPTADDEKKRYLHHNNQITDLGYVDFLMKGINAVRHHLKPGLKVLDYGCGPTAVLSQLLKKENINCDNYDPFFFPSFPEDRYDLIFSTETFEHFFHPDKELKRICSLLNKEGLLVIMTEFWKDINHFNNWHYKRDLTHVSFFHPETMLYISRNFPLKMIFTDENRIAVFKSEF